MTNTIGDLIPSSTLERLAAKFADDKEALSAQIAQLAVGSPAHKEYVANVQAGFDAFNRRIHNLTKAPKLNKLPTLPGRSK